LCGIAFARGQPFLLYWIITQFIRDLGLNNDCSAIVRAVTGLERGVEIATTPEGVETQAQLESIREEGCTKVQGNGISVPCPSAAVREFIKAWPTIRVAA
jgi:predicted signal transduction protein with EAL and GGDEF domain